LGLVFDDDDDGDDDDGDGDDGVESKRGCLRGFGV